ncbi:MAG: DUF4168 domain-containing protein [Calditrichota bacterium]
MYLFKKSLFKVAGSGILMALLLVFTACSGQQGSSGQTQNSGTTSQTPQTQQAPQDTAQMSARQQQVRQQIQQQIQQQQQQANIKVSDDELHTFSDALQSVQTIYQNSQPDMIQAIKDEGMEPQRFSQIAQSKQNPQSDLKVSPEETKQFNNALESIRQIQSKVMQKQISAVKEEGMTPERFQTILNAVRQNQDLQQRLQSMQPQPTQ